MTLEETAQAIVDVMPIGGVKGPERLRRVLEVLRPVFATHAEQKAVINALIDWWDANGGKAGPHAGSLFDADEADERTWNDVVHNIAGSSYEVKP